MPLKFSRQIIQTGVLLVFVVSLIPYPFYQVQAKSDLNHTIDDATALIYISATILLDENEIDDSTTSLGLLSLSQKEIENEI